MFPYFQLTTLCVSIFLLCLPTLKTSPCWDLKGSSVCWRKHNLQGLACGRFGAVTTGKDKAQGTFLKEGAPKRGQSGIRMPNVPTSDDVCGGYSFCKYHPSQNHYTHEILIFKSFRGLQLQLCLMSSRMQLQERLPLGKSQKFAAITVT